MTQLEFRDVVKIYPFVDVKKHFFDRKKARKMLESQKRMPYTTSEGVVAVQQYSLSVEEGEFVVLYGPSGCGKSTVLRMIAGLEDVTAGELLIDGENQEGVLPEFRDLSMVFQEYSLYPHFTVEQNIAFPLRNLHIPREEVERRTELMIRLLELQKVRREKPATLSGGEMQRTAIGRALIKRPKIFLMDEPFSNLDAPLRMKLRVMIKRIHQELGSTFIYVTHDMQEAMSLATKLVVMRDGMIVQAGAPADIYRNPADTDAASMIGFPEINLFRDACVLRDEKGCILRLLGKEYHCPQFPPSVPAGPVIAGIRPVHLEFFGDPGSERDERILCTVLLREIVGKETHFVLQTTDGAGKDQEIRAVLKAEEDSVPRLPGQEVWIRPRTSEIFLFDAETEERIGSAEEKMPV